MTAVVKKARRLWNSGQCVEAGRLLYEQIPLEYRPIWAAEILAMTRTLLPAIPQIEMVLEIAYDRSRWDEGREAFRAVRDVVLQVEDALQEGILIMAENVAIPSPIMAGGEPL